ncbi:MAG TPA: error-prone DNA polymerase [Solimonas sp.]
MTAPDYVELHALSAFSFQRGASKPDELANHALDIGYRGLAITDECSMAGVVRAHQALKERGRLDWPLIIGSEFTLRDGPKLVLLAESQRGYADICERITQGRRHAEKGEYRLGRAEFDAALPDVCALWIPRGAHERDELAWLRDRYAGRLWIAVELHRDGDDREKLARLQTLSQRFGVPLVASGDVHMHAAERRPLQDVMTALRHHTTVERSGRHLYANGERHLRAPEILARLYPAELLRETLTVAERCRFRLNELKYEYPREILGAGFSDPTAYLRHLVERHAPQRWPQGVPEKVRPTLEKELKIIAAKQYEAFFLTVYDIVQESKRRSILCQGRGSAANSVVCYVLGITEVDPEFNDLLFERFISIERNEAPDIDVDFEHERREEIIQYVYNKYGRHRAAIAATVICYRSRSSLRDVGRALAVGEEVIERVAKSLAWWDRSGDLPERLRAVGVDPESTKTKLWLQLAGQLKGFPRHLSQHVGGFVISDEPLSQLVPVENAAMADRTIIQWDKDDLESLGLLKVDVLALGMLSALRRSFDLQREFDGTRLELRGFADGHPETYAMICRAETIGVFQIESRAQMSMLPRLRPKNLYDITVQVAIVRPGPIQGGMVHPYLQSRMSGIKPAYPDEKVEKILDRTHGVPIFQEQVMKLVVAAAGFTPGEADHLRRSMAAWKRSGGLEKYEEKIKAGMAQRKYPAEFADRIYKQILGFGSYGFPESHAASFALLAYISARMKCEYPAAFIAGLVNAYPMGFYPPSMLIAEAQRMGVAVHPIDVQRSHWDCRLERDANNKAAIRLGLRLVAGFNEAAARRIEQTRAARAYDNIDDLAQRAQLSRRELDTLAAADALLPLTGHRFQARWQSKGWEKLDGLLEQAPPPDDPATLSAPHEGEDILADYQSTGLTLRRHPVALLRHRLHRARVTANGDLPQVADGRRVRVAGIVMFRQRPGSAQGTMFMTLEDDTGIVNLIIRPQLIEAEREAIVGGQFLIVQGLLQRQHEVTHVVAERFHERSHWVGELPNLSRDFR